MGRKTNQCLETTPEKIEQINPENIHLLKDFLTYLRSVDRSELTINVYENDLLIFFCWVVDNAKNKFFTEITKRDIMMFQNYALQQGCSASRVRHLKGLKNKPCKWFYRRKIWIYSQCSQTGQR